MNPAIAATARVVGIALPIAVAGILLTRVFPRPQQFSEDESTLTAGRTIDCETGFGPPEETTITAANVMTVALSTITQKAEQVGLGNDQGGQRFELATNQTATVKTDLGVCDSPMSHYANDHGHLVGRITLSSGTYPDAKLYDPVTLVWLDQANAQWRLVLIGTTTNRRETIVATYGAGLDAGRFSDEWTSGCGASKYPACFVPPPTQTPQAPHRLWFAAVRNGSFCQTGACFKTQ